MASPQMANLLLDQAEEDGLHKHRLLPVEQRPFQRLTKKVVGEGSPARFHYANGPFITPPPESSLASASQQKQTPGRASQDENQDPSTAAGAERQRWRADVNSELEFFRASIIRIQLLANANDQDRKRYDSEREKVVQKMEAVQDNMALLRRQLQQARATVALRQQYDKLVNEIDKSKSLLPREQQHTRLAGLESDIAALQRERDQYADTWSERRLQFMRIVDEGKTMLSLIRDETKEADRKEGMMGRSSSVQPEGVAGADPMVTDETDETIPTISVISASGASGSPNGPKIRNDHESGEVSRSSRSRSSRRRPKGAAASSPEPARSGSGDNLLSAVRNTPARSPSPLSRVMSPPRIMVGLNVPGDGGSTTMMSSSVAGGNDSDEDGEIVEAGAGGQDGDDRMEDV